MSEIRDISLAPGGQAKIAWVEGYMGVLGSIKERFIAEQPLKGMRISMSIHLEAKTAYLATVLAAGGAQVALTGCNPLSTQDDVAAAMAERGFFVNAWHGATPEEYTRHLTKTLSIKPHLIIDDGGDLIALLHGSCAEYGSELIGGGEETTTGVHRLRARAAAGQLKYPMIDVNDAQCKHLFDNRYGTGQSVWDGIMRTTNLLVAGRTVVIAGYGWCGRGAAMRAKGLGARVIVTEVDPVRAIEAVMDGFTVMPMDEAAPLGDLFVTLTGCKDVITARHFAVMKNGALLANAGHFDVEVNKTDLEAMAVKVAPLRGNIMGYTMADGRVLCLLAEGRLVNLASGDGHPAEIMDMSFGLQALCTEYMAKHGRSLAPGVYDIPRQIDDEVASLKLKSMGTAIDVLSEEQTKYLSGFGGEE